MANNKDQERKRGLGHGQFDNGDGGDSDGENDADDNDKRDDDSFYGNDNVDGVGVCPTLLLLCGF